MNPKHYDLKPNTFYTVWRVAEPVQYNSTYTARRFSDHTAVTVAFGGFISPLVRQVPKGIPSLAWLELNIISLN